MIFACKNGIRVTDSDILSMIQICTKKWMLLITWWIKTFAMLKLLTKVWYFAASLVMSLTIQHSSNFYRPGVAKPM